MKRSEKIFERFLNATGKLEAKALGKSETDVEISKEFVEYEKDALKTMMKQLKNAIEINKTIAKSIIYMSIILFGVGIFLIFYFLKTPAIIPALFGGSFLSLILIFKVLIKLLNEINRSKDLLVFLPELETKAVVKTIQSLYYSDKASNGSV